jgi:acyl carrier protein
MTTIFAFCGADGAIEFGPEVSPGTIAFARGREDTLRDLMAVVARHAWDGVTLLVPGVPEAANQTDAMDVMLDWCDHLRGRDGIDILVAARPGLRRSTAPERFARTAAQLAAESVPPAPAVDLARVVAAVVAEVLTIDLARAVPTADLRDDLGADFLKVINILIKLEDVLAINIPDFALADIRTVADLADLVHPLVTVGKADDRRRAAAGEG